MLFSVKLGKHECPAATYLNNIISKKKKKVIAQLGLKNGRIKIIVL